MGRELIALGVVGKAFGIRGEVRVRPHNPRSTWFDTAEGLWLRSSPAAEPEFLRILKRRRHKEFFVFTLDGVRDRDDAERLRGLEVVAAEDELEALEADEFYWYQLIGLKVRDAEGRALGEVVRIEETDPKLGGNDVLVVRGDDGEFLVPATKDAVSAIDVKAGAMTLSAAGGFGGSGGTDRG
ncbi:MAG TPA: ribosome maturation factor RimM [bacterium]|nr:ribosome maturation factor RimM [bacterium]